MIAESKDACIHLHRNFLGHLGRIKLKFNPMFDYLVQLVFVQRFPLLGCFALKLQQRPQQLLARQL